MRVGFELHCVWNHPTSKWKNVRGMRSHAKHVMPECMFSTWDEKVSVESKTWKGMVCTFVLKFENPLSDLEYEIDNIHNGADSWMEGSDFQIGKCPECVERGEHGDIEVVPKGEIKFLKWDGKPMKIETFPFPGAVRLEEDKYVMPPGGPEQPVTMKEGVLVMTGFNRGDDQGKIKKALEARGYTVEKKLTKKTDKVVVPFLVTNDTTKKARKRKIPTISHVSLLLEP